MYSEKILNKHIFINMHVSAYVCVWFLVFSSFVSDFLLILSSFHFSSLFQFDFLFLVDFDGFIFDFSS